VHAKSGRNEHFEFGALLFLSNGTQEMDIGHGLNTDSAAILQPIRVIMRNTKEVKRWGKHIQGQGVMRLIRLSPDAGVCI